jgi:hypothetical protein
MKYAPISRHSIDYLAYLQPVNGLVDIREAERISRSLAKTDLIGIRSYVSTPSRLK